MFGSPTLEIGIGIVFLFCLLSLVATSLREALEAWLQVRAANLERGIRQLLNDPDGTGATKLLYDHPLVSGLFEGSYDPASLRKPLLSRKPGLRMRFGSTLPAYIPARNFALALLDMASSGDGTNPGPLTIESLRAGIDKIENPAIKKALQVAVNHAGEELSQVQANVQKWFDSGMDRVSGWYKKHTQGLLFAIGLALAIGFNVDTVTVARALQNNPSVREALVAQAQGVAEQIKANPAADPSTLLGCGAQAKNCAETALESMPLPIGWSHMPAWVGSDGFSLANWFLTMVGWLVTAFAISLGAPFWFDILNKFMVIRSTVKPHEKSQEEASEDRQPRAAAAAPPAK